jgi:hypothetical protein
VGDTYWNTHKIDTHENEVCLGTDVLYSYRPYLRHDYTPDCSTRSSEVQTASPISGGEDLVVVSSNRTTFDNHEHERDDVLTSLPYTQAAGPNPIEYLCLRQCLCNASLLMRFLTRK